MKLSDLIVGTLLIISGAIIHLTSYQKNDKRSKMRARAGMAIIVCGSFIAFGEWMFKRVLSGN